MLGEAAIAGQQGIGVNGSESPVTVECLFKMIERGSFCALPMAAQVSTLSKMHT